MTYVLVIWTGYEEFPSPSQDAVRLMALSVGKIMSEQRIPILADAMEMMDRVTAREAAASIGC